MQYIQSALEEKGLTAQAQSTSNKCLKNKPNMNHQSNKGYTEQNAIVDSRGMNKRSEIRQ